MSADHDDERFEEVRERAVDALGEASVESAYVGLIHEEGGQEYYFGNRTETAEELRETAANQLGMLTAVLAAQSDVSVDEVLELARERAHRMDVR